MRTGLIFAIVVCTAGVSSCFADIDEVRDFAANSEQTAYLVTESNNLLPVDSVRGRSVDDAFQKTINGIPLHGGFLYAIRNANGQIVELMDDSTANMACLATVPTVEADQAVEAVENSFHDVKSTNSTSDLVWFRTGQSAKLAWEVNSQLADTGAAVSPTGMQSVIDANTGELLSQSQIDTNSYEPEGLNNDQGIFPRIVINNAIGISGSRAYAASFDATVAFTFGCTGVLIDDNVVLSARHCGAGAGSQIRFGTNISSPDFVTTVQSSFLPDGGGSLLDGGDVAILVLNSSVPANIATPMRLIDATDELEGMVCSMTGYGWNGLGSQGHGFSADNRRWGGENVIDRYGSPAGAGGSNIISTDFDNGSNGANQIGGSSPTPVEFEATTAPGDSGGPVMVQANSGEWLIAGVLSGGTTSTSVYGDVSWWTGTADFRTAIENRGGVFADPNGILLGDTNLDGVVNLLDIGPFVALVSSNFYLPEADMNQDEVVNLLDVAFFVDALSN